MIITPCNKFRVPFKAMGKNLSIIMPENEEAIEHNCDTPFDAPFMCAQQLKFVQSYTYSTDGLKLYGANNKELLHFVISK
jgi:hypothetical protein